MLVWLLVDVGIEFALSYEILTTTLLKQVFLRLLDFRLRAFLTYTTRLESNGSINYGPKTALSHHGIFTMLWPLSAAMEFLQCRGRFRPPCIFFHFISRRSIDAFLSKNDS